MKISRAWLQTYFVEELPDAHALADALTFHAFEIENIENDVLDVKVTPNRGHDALSHRGIAKDISAILNVPLKTDPLRSRAVLEPHTDLVSVRIDEPILCKRYIACYIRNVSVGPSPDWLKKALESVGQRSINNVVDATNYVMFNLGQPLHAFDAGKLSQKGESYAIAVRRAKKGERMLALDDKEYDFNESMLLITDAHDDVAIGIAGVKGGAPAGVTEETTDIIIESANFDGVSVRKTAQALKLRTDASMRFEQVISPEIPACGMRAVVDLISELAHGDVEGFVDEYPTKQPSTRVAVTVADINSVLGTDVKAEMVADVFARLGFAFEQTDESFTVMVPFERIDIAIPVDLIEEVGRIIGYDSVPAVELPKVHTHPEINARFAAAEKIREELVSHGYSEVFTSVFAEKGDVQVLNKVGGDKPFLRTNLTDGLLDAYERNAHNKDLLGLSEVKLFEIGPVWKGGKEMFVVGRVWNEKKAPRTDERELEEISADGYASLPVTNIDRYKTFSRYPFMTRDISLWVPSETSSDDVLGVIRASAGDLLVRCDLFDHFQKGERTSYAFRLVFQSFDKTLTDGDANERMESVYKAVKERGWEVR